MPPGTGDIALSLSQSVPVVGRGRGHDAADRVGGRHAARGPDVPEAERPDARADREHEPLRLPVVLARERHLRQGRRRGAGDRAGRAVPRPRSRSTSRSASAATPASRSPSASRSRPRRAPCARRRSSWRRSSRSPIQLEREAAIPLTQVEQTRRRRSTRSRCAVTQMRTPTHSDSRRALASAARCDSRTASAHTCRVMAAAHRHRAEDRAGHEQQEHPPPAIAGRDERQQSACSTIVNRKPAQVCSVSAVPTCVRALCSVTSAENCAESATTVKPQTTASTQQHRERRAVEQPGGGRTGAAGEQREPAIRALPQRSAQSPATTQPTAPLAIATNATSDPSAAVRCPGCRQRGGGKRRDPRPHRVELPHVPEVAERREPRAAVAHDGAERVRDRTAPMRDVRAVLDEQRTSAPPTTREHRRAQHQRPPRQVGGAPREQVRKRRAEGQRADDDAERACRGARETSRRRSSCPADRRTRAPRRSASAAR